jgi:hypothetical protein
MMRTKFNSKFSNAPNPSNDNKSCCKHLLVAFQPQILIFDRSKCDDINDGQILMPDPHQTSQLPLRCFNAFVCICLEATHVIMGDADIRACLAHDVESSVRI